MRVGRALLVVAAATAALAACANVVGVSDRRDVVEELCVCTTLPDCEASLTEALSAASEEDLRAWLASYDKLACAEANCQTTALQCFYTAPGLCGEQGAACERSEACCGFDHGEPREAAGCCAGEGGACCSHCEPCADLVDAYALGMPYDEAGLCLSQKQSWDDLESCAEANCQVACAIDEPTCRACLGTDCEAAFKACGNDAGF